MTSLDNPWDQLLSSAREARSWCSVSLHFMHFVTHPRHTPAPVMLHREFRLGWRFQREKRGPREAGMHLQWGIKVPKMDTKYEVCPWKYVYAHGGNPWEYSMGNVHILWSCGEVFMYFLTGIICSSCSTKHLGILSGSDLISFKSKGLDARTNDF